jgi:hypothetical protein
MKINYFTFSSDNNTRVYETLFDVLDPSVLGFSLSLESLHRHQYVCILFNSRLISYNKQKQNQDMFHFQHVFYSHLKSKVDNILNKTKTTSLSANINIDGLSITSRSHTHPSHSHTSHFSVSSSLFLGIPFPRSTQCV